MSVTFGAEGRLEHSPFLPVSLGTPESHPRRYCVCGAPLGQALACVAPEPHPPFFSQKLLEAHEEQNVDSYTEAVSGWWGWLPSSEVVLRISSFLSLAPAPGCGFLSPVTPEASQVAPRGAGSSLPILEMSWDSNPRLSAPEGQGLCTPQSPPGEQWRESHIRRSG